MKKMRLGLIFVLLLGWRPEEGLEFRNRTPRGPGQVTQLLSPACLTPLLPRSLPSLEQTQPVPCRQAFTAVLASESESGHGTSQAYGWAAMRAGQA